MQKNNIFSNDVELMDACEAEIRMQLNSYI